MYYKMSLNFIPIANKNHDSAPLKRLRPERPKREIPDYEYCDDYTRISMNGDSQVKTISKRMKFFDDVDEDGRDDDDEDDAFANILSGKVFERSDSMEVRPYLMKYCISFTFFSKIWAYI